MNNRRLPYGIFSGAKISKKEIDEITSNFNKEVDELSKKT